MNIKSKHLFSKIDKIILQLLAVVIRVVEWIFFIASTFTLLGGVLFFVVSNIPNKEIQHDIQYSLTENFSPTWIFLSLVLGAIILFCFGLAMRYTNIIINNLANSIFFTIINLNSIKKILYVLLLASITQWIANILFLNFNLQNVSDIFSRSFGGLLGSPVMLIIIYVIYLVFKYGLSLQEDSDKVI
jgi:hypothetical protein